MQFDLVAILPQAIQIIIRVSDEKVTVRDGIRQKLLQFQTIFAILPDARRSIAVVLF